MRPRRARCHHPILPLAKTVVELFFDVFFNVPFRVYDQGSRERVVVPGGATESSLFFYNKAEILNRSICRSIPIQWPGTEVKCRDIKHETFQ